jgi:uncharacterized damage-inducible protein DinB
MEFVMKHEPPQFPAGPFSPVSGASTDDLQSWIRDIAILPEEIRKAVNGLSDAQLDTKYRNWTIRQIVHHIADSHVNCYIRFKWAMTEDSPTIKAYDEGHWSALPESMTGNIGPSLQLIDGLHARWVQFISSMTETDFERTFFHPESQETVSLKSALPYYAWHGKHHTGQILWLRDSF